MAVVHQFYQSEVNNEYVIRGNSAILKCSIPSFVADFVTVVSWNDENGEIYAPNEIDAQKNFGLFNKKLLRQFVTFFHLLFTL